MTSLQFNALLQLLRANPTPDDVSIADSRAGMETMAAQTPLPTDAYMETITAVSVPGLLIAAADARDERVILYLHGGLYVLGSSNTHRDFAYRLSQAAQARVLVIDYRLAPEHPFPAALEDTLTAYRWLLENGIEPQNIAFVGDSSGGGLALSALVALRDAGDPLPKTAVCLCPWVDLTLTEDSLQTNSDSDPLLSVARLQRFANLYLDEADPQTPLASPLYAELTNLPSLLIHTGTADLLHSDAQRLDAKAKAANLDVTFTAWEEMIHVWHAFAAFLPEAQEALTEVGTFLQTQFSSQ
ncbi:MAG: alpha/beta hydrolase [Chloroflexota bacterium]